MTSILLFIVLTLLSYLGVGIIRRYADNRTGVNPRATPTKPTEVGSPLT